MFLGNLVASATLHSQKSNPQFRDITQNVEEHEIFRVVSRFPRYISCYIAENRLPLGQCIPYCCWENINSAWLVRKVHFFSIMHIHAYPPPLLRARCIHIFPIIIIICGGRQFLCVLRANPGGGGGGHKKLVFSFAKMQILKWPGFGCNLVTCYKKLRFSSMLCERATDPSHLAGFELFCLAVGSELFSRMGPLRIGNCFPLGPPRVSKSSWFV